MKFGQYPQTSVKLVGIRLFARRKAVVPTASPTKAVPVLTSHCIGIQDKAQGITCLQNRIIYARVTSTVLRSG